MFIKLVLVGVAIAFSSLAFAGNYDDAKPSVRDACSRYFSMLEKEGLDSYEINKIFDEAFVTCYVLTRENGGSHKMAKDNVVGYMQVKLDLIKLMKK